MSAEHIYMAFIIPLGTRIHVKNCEDHSKAMTDPDLIEGAERLIQDDDACKKYCNLIIEALIDIFSFHMTYIGRQIPNAPLGFVNCRTDFIIRDPLPPKECYTFINLLMTIYAHHGSQCKSKLPYIVFNEIKQWLVANENTVKPAKIN
jgi:hypothetical protein